MFKIEGNTVVNAIVTKKSDFCEQYYPNETWVEGFMEQTPRRYPGIGWSYDSTANVGFGEFISPKTFDSWILNESLEWEPPVPRPEDGNSYVWNENTTQWEQM